MMPPPTMTTRARSGITGAIGRSMYQAVVLGVAHVLLRHVPHQPRATAALEHPGRVRVQRRGRMRPRRHGLRIERARRVVLAPLPAAVDRGVVPLAEHLRAARELLAEAAVRGAAAAAVGATAAEGVILLAQRGRRRLA